MGSLTIVGLGPARPEHMTAEAQGLIKEATHLRWYALAHARGMAEQINPNIKIASLDYLYNTPTVERPVAYRDLAKMMVRKAYVDDIDVGYIVAGSPLFYNDAVLFIRRLCAEQGLEFRLVHGMSFVDLVLDQVGWTGWHGLQLYSAWNIARDGLQLSTAAPALLCQLGEFTAASDALNPEGSPIMLEELREALLAHYPSDHLVSILYSSGKPDYQSLSKTLPLSALASEPIPVYSNLWVPSIDDPSEGAL